MYAAKTLIIIIKEEDLRILEKRILRKIYDPIKVTDEEYRSRINFVLKQ